MLIECDSCGAPLDVVEKASTSKCRYCGKTSRVRSLRTVAFETPPDWQPPRTWTPPTHMPAPQAPLAYQAPNVARKLTAIVGSLSGLITTAVIGFFVFNLTKAPLASLQSMNQSGALSADLKKTMADVQNQINGVVAVAGNVAPPVVCSGNEVVSVSGKVIALATGTPIVASGNCQVTLSACTVTGATAIAASDNAHITVNGGALMGTAATIKASGNAVVTLTGGAVAVGDPALSATNNAKITLDHATAQGRVAATTSVNGSIDATGGTLQGAIAGTRRVKK